MMPKLPKVDCRYGAPMGRRASYARPPSDEPLKFHLQRVPLDSGGYDSGGAYWGHGEPLWWYMSVDGEVDAFLRAGSRMAAKAAIRASYPNARFFR